MELLAFAVKHVKQMMDFRIKFSHSWNGFVRLMSLTEYRKECQHIFQWQAKSQIKRNKRFIDRHCNRFKCLRNGWLGIWGKFISIVNVLCTNLRRRIKKKHAKMRETLEKCHRSKVWLMRHKNLLVSQWMEFCTKRPTNNV